MSASLLSGLTFFADVFLGGRILKAILFDIDGVIIRHEEWFPSTLSENEHHDPLQIMNQYHTGYLNYACDRNHLDPLKEIYPFLKRIGWNGTAVEYFQQKYEC